MDPIPGLISGVVYDSAGEPLKQARVCFKTGPVPLQEIGALTNSRGEFTLVAPVQGTYEIYVAADGFFAASMSVTVPAGSTEPIEIRLSE